MSATATRKLGAREVRAIVDAEIAAAKAKAEHDRLAGARDELRERYKPRIPPSSEAKDVGRDVRQVEAGGLRVRVSTFAGGEYFSLKEYREAGGQITAAMEPHVHAGDPRERWTVKDLAGPKRPDAIEPT